jgi:hypothetical protein
MRLRLRLELDGCLLKAVAGGNAQTVLVLRKKAELLRMRRQTDGDSFIGRRQDNLMIIMSAVVTTSFKLSRFMHVNLGNPCLVIAYQPWYWG